MARFFSLHTDFIGFLASFLCAIHCLALPAVLSVGALGGLAWLHHPLLEWGLIVFAVVVASWSLLGTWFRYGGTVHPLVLAGIGFSVLAASRFAHGDAEHYLTAIGGLLIAGAHYLNWGSKSCELKQASA